MPSRRGRWAFVAVAGHNAVHNARGARSAAPAVASRRGVAVRDGVRSRAPPLLPPLQHPLPPPRQHTRSNSTAIPILVCDSSSPCGSSSESDGDSEAGVINLNHTSGESSPCDDHEEFEHSFDFTNDRTTNNLTISASTTHTPAPRSIFSTLEVSTAILQTPSSVPFIPELPPLSLDGLKYHLPNPLVLATNTAPSKTIHSTTALASKTTTKTKTLPTVPLPIETYTSDHVSPGTSDINLLMAFPEDILFSSSPHDAHVKRHQASPQSSSTKAKQIGATDDKSDSELDEEEIEREAMRKRRRGPSFFDGKTSISTNNLTFHDGDLNNDGLTRFPSILPMSESLQYDGAFLPTGKATCLGDSEEHAPDLFMDGFFDKTSFVLPYGYLGEHENRNVSAPVLRIFSGDMFATPKANVEEESKEESENEVTFDEDEDEETFEDEVCAEFTGNQGSAELLGMNAVDPVPNEANVGNNEFTEVVCSGRLAVDDNDGSSAALPVVSEVPDQSYHNDQSGIIDSEQNQFSFDESFGHLAVGGGFNDSSMEPGLRMMAQPKRTIAIEFKYQDACTTLNVGEDESFSAVIGQLASTFKLAVRYMRLVYAGAILSAFATPRIMEMPILALIDVFATKAAYERYKSKEKKEMQERMIKARIQNVTPRAKISTQHNLTGINSTSVSILLQSAVVTEPLAEPWILRLLFKLQAAADDDASSDLRLCVPRDKLVEHIIPQVRDGLGVSADRDVVLYTVDGRALPGSHAVGALELKDDDLLYARVEVDQLKLRFRIQGQGTEAKLRVAAYCAFSRLMPHVREQLGLQPTAKIYLVGPEGDRLSEASTVADAGLEDEDLVHVTVL